MGKKIPQVDAYIAKSQDFAKPILTHIRDVVHKACPDVEEAIKWGMPFFMYNGKMMCMMSGFKQHAAMGFYKASLMSDPELMANASSENSMGHVGRMESIKDMPSDKKLTAWIKEAMKLNEERAKMPKKKPTEKEKKSLVIPKYVTTAFSKHKKVNEVFNAFPYSHKKEYVQW